MINTLDLRRHIIGLITPVHSRVYYESAPEAAVMPYIVVDLPNSFSDGDSESFVLDVDGWDNSTSTAALETLMGNVDAALNQTAAHVSGAAVAIYRDSRLSMVDPDPRIRRRKYTYQVKTY